MRVRPQMNIYPREFNLRHLFSFLSCLSDLLDWLAGLASLTSPEAARKKTITSHATDASYYNNIRCRSSNSAFFVTPVEVAPFVVIYLA